MKQFAWLSLLLISVFTLAGCGTGGSNTQTPEDAWPESTLQTIASESATPVLASTLQPAIPDTNQPLPTVTVRLSIATTINTPASTLVNTLEPEKARATMQSLFTDPMDCAVPCFWGIMPEKTHLDDAKIFFSRLGFTPFEGTDPNSGRNFYTIEYKSDTSPDFSATLFSSNNLVENVVIRPRIDKPQEGKPREWIAYSPETLIKQYGEPTRVELAVDKGPNYVVVMIMYFDESDLIVLYSGYNMFPDRPHSPRLCPLTAPFDYLRLWLGANPPNPPTMVTIPLEKATAITTEQFTQLVAGDPRLACFVINGDEFQ